MKNLIAAIMTKCADSDLSNYVGGRIYIDEAEQKAEFPYVVFKIISSAPESTFTEEFTDTLLQASLFSTSDSVVEIMTMDEYLNALFDECDLTITGSTLIWMRRTNLVTMTDSLTTENGQRTLRHWAEDYEIKTSLN
jgi:hypothetical protein